MDKHLKSYNRINCKELNTNEDGKRYGRVVNGLLRFYSFVCVSGWTRVDLEEKDGGPCVYYCVERDGLLSKQ